MYLIQRFFLHLICFSSALQVLVLTQEKRTTFTLTFCGTGYLLCGDRYKCISPTDLCNFRNDCDDGSDEDRDLCTTYLRDQKLCAQGDVRGYNHSDYELIRNKCIDVLAACSTWKFGSYDVCMYLQHSMLSPRKSEHREDAVYEQCLNFSTTSTNEQETGCPAHYTKCRTECLSLNIPISMSWEGAKGICESKSGSLKTFTDAEDLRKTVECLTQADVKTNFWIGGFFNGTSPSQYQPYNEEQSKLGKWVWSDGREMPLGMPYWALYSTVKEKNYKCSTYTQALRPLKYDGMCVSMKYEDFYYFSEDSCQTRATPLCVSPQL